MNTKYEPTYQRAYVWYNENTGEFYAGRRVMAMLAIRNAIWFDNLQKARDAGLHLGAPWRLVKIDITMNVV